MADLQTFVLKYNNAGTVQVDKEFAPRSYQTGLESLFRTDIGETELVISDKDTYVPINKALADEPRPHYRVVVPTEYVGANLVKLHAPGVVLVFANEKYSEEERNCNVVGCTYKNTFEDKPTYIVATAAGSATYIAEYNATCHAKIAQSNATHHA